MTEGAVVNSCIKALYQLGCFVWRNNTGAWKPEGSDRPIYYGRKGSPDIIGMTKSGRFIGVECKSGKNKLNPEQEKFRDDILAHRGLHITVWSVDDIIARQSEILA